MSLVDFEVAGADLPGPVMRTVATASGGCCDNPACRSAASTASGTRALTCKVKKALLNCHWKLQMQLSYTLI